MRNKEFSGSVLHKAFPSFLSEQSSVLFLTLDFRILKGQYCRTGFLITLMHSTFLNAVTKEEQTLKVLLRARTNVPFLLLSVNFVVNRLYPSSRMVTVAWCPDIFCIVIKEDVYSIAWSVCCCNGSCCPNDACSFFCRASMFEQTVPCFCLCAIRLPCLLNICPENLNPTQKKSYMWIRRTIKDKVLVYSNFTR